MTMMITKYMDFIMQFLFPAHLPPRAPLCSFTHTFCGRKPRRPMYRSLSQSPRASAIPWPVRVSWPRRQPPGSFSES